MFLDLQVKYVHAIGMTRANTYFQHLDGRSMMLRRITATIQSNEKVDFSVDWIIPITLPLRILLHWSSMPEWNPVTSITDVLPDFRS